MQSANDPAGGTSGSGTGSGAGTGGGTSGAGGAMEEPGTGTGAGTGGAGTGAGLGGSPAGTGEPGGIGEDFDLHEPEYRRHYTTTAGGEGGAAGTYDEARTGYALGHSAAANPAYADRGYEEVEVELRRDYGDTGRYERVREFARHAFEWKRVLAGVALLAGGYWASRRLSGVISDLSEEDERDCRTFYDTHAARSGGVPYNHARTVYVLGYVAARNPEYAGRGYEEIEPHLRGGFTGRRAGSYDALRDFGRRGYERGSARGSV
ncbi:MAG TPA: hypothetical protein VHG08_23955 [Longimicrobium sp.]|nr:hypothetical protein [Longimicrobium sp.]